MLLRSKCSISSYHSRPSADIANFLEKNKLSAVCRLGDKKADARSIIELLGLNVKFGDELSWEVTGEDEKERQFAEFIKEY